MRQKLYSQNASVLSRYHVPIFVGMCIIILSLIGLLVWALSTRNCTQYTQQPCTPEPTKPVVFLEPAVRWEVTYPTYSPSPIYTPSPSVPTNLSFPWIGTWLLQKDEPRATLTLDRGGIAMGTVIFQKVPMMMPSRYYNPTDSSFELLDKNGQKSVATYDSATDSLTILNSKNKREGPFYRVSQN